MTYVNRNKVSRAIADADAAVGDVRNGKTFYAGAKPKKTGTADLSEHQNSEATDVGVSTEAGYTAYYDTVADGATVLSASITTTERCCIVVVAMFVALGLNNMA